MTALQMDETFLSFARGTQKDGILSSSGLLSLVVVGVGEYYQAAKAGKNNILA
jgi:hypothetical protein